MKIYCQFALVFFLVSLSHLVAQEVLSNAVSGDVMVRIGDVGNAPYMFNKEQLGAVNHAYQLGAYEQTVQDWFLFLTAVASQLNNKQEADPHGLWNEGMTSWIKRSEKSDGSYCYELVEGTENLPITHVSFYNALRKCNWQEQGAPILKAGEDSDAITEHGAYEFVEEHQFTSNPKAHFYIPSRDEWIKAAYYKGSGLESGFWSYPTQNNNPPGNHEGDVTNQANYKSRSWFSSAPVGLRTVDFFPYSKSYYGCFDMGGNVNEWTSTPFNHGYIVRGGSYQSEYNYIGPNDLMITAKIESILPETESALIGFRIAAREEDAEALSSSNEHRTQALSFTSMEGKSAPSNAAKSDSGWWNSLNATQKAALVVGGTVLLVAGVALLWWCLPEIGVSGAVAGGEEAGAAVTAVEEPSAIKTNPTAVKASQEALRDRNWGKVVMNLNKVFQTMGK